MPTRRSVIAASLAVPAILSGSSRVRSQTRPVLRVAVQALPPTLEPIESISNVGLRITDNIFDTLIRRDFLAEAATGRPALVPSLATGLTQRDPLTWAASLRAGVRLHDGREMTADDVVATFSPERMWGQKAPFYEGRIAFGHLAEVVAEDARTVIFRTRAPDVVMAKRLAAYAGWVCSSQYLAQAGLEGMRVKPVGTGPYRLASFQRDQRVVLDAFDEYWMGPPPARQVSINVVPEAAARLAGLQAGDFDLVTNLLPDQIPALANNRHVEAVAVPLDFAHILYYDTRRPALRDPRIRRALNHAVDYELMGRALWGDGFRRMAALQLPSFGDFYDRDREGFPYDPDKAKRLLAEAGWRGEEIVVRIPADYYLNLLPATQIVQEMWRAVGVPSLLEVRDNLASVTQPGADVRPTSIAFRFADPLGGGLMVHLAKDYFIQAQGYWTPTAFNEISDAFRAATDPAERHRLWLRLLDEYEAEAPAMILYPVQEVIGKRRDLRFTHYPLYYLDLRSYNLGFA
ncbi:MAG: ABC transporter substrate-binding protein [Hyphomicrobiales bacterium]